MTKDIGWCENTYLWRAESNRGVNHPVGRVVVLEDVGPIVFSEGFARGEPVLRQRVLQVDGEIGGLQVLREISAEVRGRRVGSLKTRGWLSEGDYVGGVELVLVLLVGDELGVGWSREEIVLS